MSRDDFANTRPAKRRRTSPAQLEKMSQTVVDNGAPSEYTESEGDGSEEQDLEEDEDGEDDGTHEAISPELPQSQRNPFKTNGQGTLATPTSRPPILKSLSDHLKPSSTGTFQLQVEDFLEQAKADYGKLNQPVNEVLLKLKTSIENIPERSPQPLKEAEKQLLKSKIAIPFPQPRPANDVLYRFGYAKPSSINVVGSYALKTVTKVDAGLNIDLVVHMPVKLFETKDYLNYRYFHKRAYYLACVAAGLRNTMGQRLDLKFSLAHDNPLLPIICLQERRDSSNGLPSLPSFIVRILPAMEDGVFPPGKTLPGCNCVRKASVATDARQTGESATPFYNASLRSDSSINGFLKLQHAASARCEGFRDACVLGGTWLRQRGMDSLVSSGGFGRFEFSTTVALLMESGGPKGKPALSAAYNGLQLFGATLHFLAQRDLLKQPLVIGSILEPENGQPILFDGARSINILYKMTASSYGLLRREAQNSAKMFGSSSTTKFESLFNLKLSEPLLRFDLLFNLSQVTESDSLKGAERFYIILDRGLGNRAATLSACQSQSKPWPINTSRASRKADVTIGIVLDPANASRAVDRGPSAEDAAGTTSFREFWGDKAELRRFKDGEIRESLVWSGKEPIEITKEIILFLIERHAGMQLARACSIVGNAFEAPMPSVPQLAKHQAEFSKTLASYRLLESNIRSLDGLPLQIRQIQATGVRLRNSLVYDESCIAPPTDVVVQFEGSNRWPDDLVAIQMTKIAFLLKMEELLTDVEAVELTRIGLENEQNDVLNRAFLDVLHSGEWFRIRIHNEKEQALIERRLADKAITPRQRENTALALAEYKRLFIRAPLLTQTVQRIATEFPAFPQTVRLVKSWFNSQLLGNHFRDELIELITAKTFLDPQPWSVPSSPMTGFLRTISFIARWDWQWEPLIVDFSAGMKAGELAPIHTKFEAWRQIDPLMNRVCLFAATNVDADGATWSEYNPTKVVAARMSGLARAAMKLVKDKGTALNLASLFRPSLKEYDFVLRLKQKAKPKEGGDRQFKNLRRVGNNDVSDAGFASGHLLLEDLQRTYGDSALFFADLLHGNVIAGLWNPHARRRRWKVNLGWSTIPVAADNAEGDYDALVNQDAMLAEMARLGGDLILSLEHRSP